VVGCLVLLARWCGVRGRWHYVVAVLGIVGFILLARTDPSVVRAAAMGGAALLGLARNGTDRGLRALGVAVVGLLAWDPWLATTVGFALSVLATAGILLLTPGWVARMSTWVPRWVAQAVTVPLAAQLACTPVIDRKSTRLNSSHVKISYAVFCLKKKKKYKVKILVKFQ